MSNATNDWRPNFFREFHDNITKASEFLIKKHSVRMVPSANGKNVDGLTAAASKWRVANSIQSFNAIILPHKSTRKTAEIPENQISQSLCESYSAQMQVALAVFAFEAYARCFGKRGHDWNQHKQIVFKKTVPILSNELRTAPGSKKMHEQIEKFLTKEEQKLRLESFFSGGNDQYLYDVCHFLRHGYAHGALPAYEGLIDVAPKLKAFILDGIRDHMGAIVSDCLKEDKA